MSKLYVFGIGGTGSRVINSLVMLLANGVDFNTTEVVPIIIDPDQSAGNKTECIEHIHSYNNIRNYLKFDNTTRNKFFRMILNTGIVPNCEITLQQTNTQKFNEYINYNSLSKENQAFVSTLFSEKNLSADMKDGFKGNPNIGSVVLNQFGNSPEFELFANSFQQGDRIFVVSSIFGGTGASGFPLLVKNVRGIDPNKPNAELIRKAPIGAITVLPYFRLNNDPSSEIDSSTFISKTKAALAYYDKHLTETDVHYYIGDNIGKNYNNCEGGSNQRNDAHLIEFLSALSIIDFMSVAQESFANQPLYKEYGLNPSYKEDNDSVIFADLPSQTRNLVQKAMTQWLYFGKYLVEQMNNTERFPQPWFKNLHLKDNNFTNTPFYSSLLKYYRDYTQWLTEMSQNRRAFCPFDLREDKDHLFELVKGVSPRKKFLQSNNYAYFDKLLNEYIGKMNQNNMEQQFVELFYSATEKIWNEKFNQ